MENEETLTCGSGNHNKIKADYAGIIARRVSIQKYKEATYFEILYLDTGDNVWHVGFGSYMLEFVEMWLNTEFEHTYKPITTAITDLLSRAEAAQETLQRAMAEYKARAEKAERERDAAVNDLKKEVMGKIWACDYCKKNDPDDFQCTHDDLCGCHEWEWRGQKEE